MKSGASRSTARSATAAIVGEVPAHPSSAGRLIPRLALKVVQGTAKIYRSSENGRRHFCPDCGTGLFYFNAVNLPGIADIQTATLDDPTAIAPKIHVQTAERIAWMEHAHELPTFERYPTRD